MEYSINKLSKLAGVSTRTLRYYDEIGLLSPKRVSNGYRIYSKTEVDLLQQILLFRELGISLEEIKKIVYAKEYDRISALQGHLSELVAKREQIETLIANVEKTIAESRGELTMEDREKFEGFKQNLITENEKTYGSEIREKFSNEVIDASNTKIKNMTSDEYEYIQKLSAQINEFLKEAHAKGDPNSELAQKVCELHREWIGYYWDHYSKEAHLGLAKLYVDDSRFKKYYDDIEEGCAEFLYAALKVYCS